MPKKFKVTLEAVMEVEDNEDGLKELKNLYLFSQSGSEIQVSKVQAIEQIPYKLEAKGGSDG